MFNVCNGCGTYNAAKDIQPYDVGGKSVWAIAECPTCGYQHKFRKLPLFIVCGASGTGKTAVCSALSKEVTACIPLEGDILWCPAFDRPDEKYRDFFEIWLRLAKNIGQAGRPVMLFNAGAGVPENTQNCIERRYFSAVYVLALVCDSLTLAQRLLTRLSWRNSSEAFIQKQQEFNSWYREAGPTLDPPITLLDTSKVSVEETVSSLKGWIAPYLQQIACCKK